MLHKRRSLGTRKVSPPQPICMTDDQKASYLINLRQNRPTRPGGARPLPGRPAIVQNHNDSTLSRSGSTISLQPDDREMGSNRYSIPNSNSMPLMGNTKGRPLVQAPSDMPLMGNGSVTSKTIKPGELRYRESMSREIEKREAHSLREALEVIDYADEESRVYEAAQKEAADLVWKHLNPQSAEEEKVGAYKNPDLNKDRKQSIPDAQQHIRTGSQKSISDIAARFEDCKIEGLRLSKRGAKDEQPNTRNYRRRSSGKRLTSNGSNKGVFRNPEDQIYEEPEVMDTLITKKVDEDLPLQSRPRNPVLRGTRPLPEKPHTVPLPEKPKHNRFDIYKNPPSQLRKADYTSNPPSREATPEIETPKGRAMEIRSDEIRAATSMKRKDRSPKLPTPTAVSDRPGRPIVSFDPGWRPGMESPKTSLDLERARPNPLQSMSQSAPAVPTISVSESIPTINLPDNDQPTISVITVPTINLPDSGDNGGSDIPTINVSAEIPTRPLPQITDKVKARPLPSHTQSAPGRPAPTRPANRVPWLSRGPMSAGATATCNACQLTIAGRIVTASGSVQGGAKVRFHPECFTCHHCSTALECISFYPEPENAREERFQKDLEADRAEMRFFCHLDYHDLYSPRCASCKTPIEGSVVLAAGKSWHEGHFFCAECGDPFGSNSPFVEDRGYAYCVGCHTKRTSARCRGCKKQILDEVSVEALGGKWHEECFRCDECGGDFGDDGRFFVREIEVQPTDKEKRKGLAKKFEDRAVCHGCEELRLRRHEAFL